VDNLDGRLAVVTGGGSGIGRELVRSLASLGCSVATCDINATAVEATAIAVRETAPASTRITSHHCDVSDPAWVERFRDEVLTAHETKHINLLINNAGVGGGGSFLTGPQTEWERTFAITWGGVYNCTRAFMAALVASDAGYLVNVSSVNGFWASLGPGVPHTAYSTAKFAVKGFTEALLEDFRLNAPHVKVAVVMPGHIGTDIGINSVLIHAGDMTDADRIARSRTQLGRRGVPVDTMSDEQVAAFVQNLRTQFRDNAPTTAAEAAQTIVDGIRAGEWRILIGDDAHRLDERVRADPTTVYGPDGVGAVPAVTQATPQAG
jgi:NAD(P)-dependent dehydrogenase (short-subunit alcohol dehydrogenase family)